MVYRLGGLALEDIEKIVGKVKLELNQSSDPKAPGQLKTHYAPRKPLLIGEVEELKEKAAGKKIAVISFKKYYEADYVIVLSEKGDLREAAQKLFSAMRKLDESDSDIIIAEKFPDDFLGRAINDRLKRASVQ
jgi:L-threonylcarbamoyladenylate synthase